MCGIVTVWRDESVAPLAAPVRRAMCDALQHRGPDDSGEETLDSGRLWFGHRRLAVLDLSARGRQPMSRANGRFWITYNGEIYNYRELRRELEAGGATFTSGTDTEVILAAYERWGTDCLPRLNGMWAFALWDAERRELFVARDRFGIKPLYVADGPGWFALASEMRALLASGLVAARPHAPAVSEYLASGQVDGLRDTMISGVRRFPPGHYSLTREPRLDERRFWSLPEADASGAHPDLDEEAARLHDHLRDAVSLRLVSDVPVGTCLSGGMDSSAIFAFANGAAGDPLQAFTAYFTESEEFDERRYARAMCERYGAEQHLVKPDASKLWELLPRIVWHLEEPPLAMGVFPQWHVLELAAARVTVVLDGQGGDEVLAGYDRYVHRRVQELARRGEYLQLVREIRAVSDRVRARSLYATAFPRLARLRPRTGRAAAPPPDLAACMDADLLRLRPEEPALSRVPADLVDRQLARDVEYQSLPALLKYEDKLGMAFSLEARLPFLDWRLVDFLFRLGSDMKFARGWSKLLLRVAMQDLLPEEVCWRRDKRGFPTPVDAWFRGELAESLRERITAGQAVRHGWLDAARLHALIDRHVSGALDASRDLWRAACIETWLDQLGALTDRRHAAPPARAPRELSA